MAVKLDLSEFQRRIYRLRREFASETPGSIADTSAEEIAGQIQFKYKTLANSSYRFDTQVGITRDAFNNAISGVYRIGNARFGILNLRAMGTEIDITKIASIPGLWHQGTRAFDSFKTKVLGDPKNASKVAGLRAAYWGTRVPQWIFLEYGDDGSTGTITPPGLSLTYTKDPKYIWRRWINSIKNKIKSARI